MRRFPGGSCVVQQAQVGRAAARTVEKEPHRAAPFAGPGSMQKRKESERQCFRKCCRMRTINESKDFRLL